jgi:hypothetical protein
VALRSNTNGQFTRATDLPDNATGWTMCCWINVTSTEAAYRVLMGVTGASGIFEYLGVNTSTTVLQWLHNAGGAFSDDDVATLSTGTWYFVAIRMISGTQVEILYRAFGAESLSSTGTLTIANTPPPTWTDLWLMGSDTATEEWSNAEAHSFRLWHATLNSTEILAESKSPVPVRTSNIDSALTLRDATDPGDDESGNARDWTPSGTFATVDYVPALMSLITAGGTAFALTANSGVSADLPLASATGTAHAPSAVATQPASLPLASASGVAHAPSAAATQPSSLPLATATGTAHAPQAGGAMLPTATAVAEAHAPTADDGSPPVRQLPMSRGRGAGRRFGAV